MNTFANVLKLDERIGWGLRSGVVSRGRVRMCDDELASLLLLLFSLNPMMFFLGDFYTQ